jgi:hypothetical protein
MPRSSLARALGCSLLLSPPFVLPTPAFAFVSCFCITHLEYPLGLYSQGVHIFDVIVRF